MSRILKEMHETARDMQRLGIISNERMKEYDRLCLPEVPIYTAEKIKAMREGFSLTQSALARILNVSASTVQKWEIGNKKPAGAARKLLSILDTKGINALL